MLDKRAQQRVYEERRRSKPGYKERQHKFYQSWYKRRGKSAKRRAYKAEYQRKYRRDPAKRMRLMARWIVSNYIANGRIKKKPCSGCGKKKAESHHPDYEKPLEIIWLCRSCHLAEARRIKAAVDGEN